MNIEISGIGWIKKGICGQFFKNLSYDYDELRSAPSLLVQKSILPSVINKFNSFDTVSKATCCAVALGLDDANISFMTHKMEDVGIIGTNQSGCLESNLKYFKDYVAGGRNLARGKLFIYTLPSTPYAAAAIHFNCQGPLIYTGSSQAQTSSLLIQAKNMVSTDQASGMLAILAEQNYAVCFVIIKNHGQLNGKSLPLDKVISGLDNETDINEIINLLSM